MLFVVTEKNNQGDAIAVEYPLSFENVHERFLAPMGKSKTDVDLQYLSMIGVYPVRAVDAPVVDSDTFIKSVLPIFVGGEWVESYVTEAKTEEQIANDLAIQGAMNRRQRDILLNMSDWTQLPDSPLSTEKKQQWANYRQQLRDLPLQEGYPFTVTWPKQP